MTAADGRARHATLDTRAMGAAELRDVLPAWQAAVGDDRRLTSYSADTLTDFRVRVDVVGVHDVVIHRQHSLSRLHKAVRAVPGDPVLLFFLRRGEMVVDYPEHRDSVTVPAGGFSFLRMGRPTDTVTRAGSLGYAIALPEAGVGSLLRGPTVRGSARTAEMRLLTAHAGLVQQHAAELTAAGSHAARDVLVELAGAVLRGAADGADSRLAPALAQAARELADRRLSDPGLGAPMLARELHVSVRTLQRAFAAEGETVSDYIRGRRLDEVRRDLRHPASGRTIAELAARWHFADGSHLSRAFRRRYGLLPSDERRGRPASGRRGTDVPEG